MPPCVGAKPPEPPLLRGDEFWLQPIESARIARPPLANSPDTVFRASLVMEPPFDLAPPSGAARGRDPSYRLRGGAAATTPETLLHHIDGIGVNRPGGMARGIVTGGTGGPSRKRGLVAARQERDFRTVNAADDSPTHRTPRKAICVAALRSHEPLSWNKSLHPGAVC